jgi:hypothetical protein
LSVYDYDFLKIEELLNVKNIKIRAKELIPKFILIG